MSTSIRFANVVVAQPLSLQIVCPKCTGRLGSFNWAGNQCSCGAWITPAFLIHKAKVDVLPAQQTLPLAAMPRPAEPQADASVATPLTEEHQQATP